MKNCLTCQWEPDWNHLVISKRGMTMNKILWFVTYGPDSSHMWEAKPFDKLKDAREFANNLPLGEGNYVYKISTKLLY